MESQTLGRMLITVGLITVFAGLIFVFKDKIPGLDKLGNLPGDISYENNNIRIYFPLATSLLISLILSLLLWLFRSKG